VVERAEAKQISAESTFDADLTTLVQLRDAAAPIAEHAHRRLERDGRGARTVTVKLKKSDMSTLTRSATLPYATADAGALISLARRLLLDPSDIGPIRLVGVGFSGLSDVLQESLFPDLENRDLESPDLDYRDLDPSDAAPPETAGDVSDWRVGDDVTHPTFGHGWVQGAGHGVVSVRFETRASGPGVMRTFAIDTADLKSSDPRDSLDWPSAPAGDDGVDG
jgi:DNA polymerase-4